MTVEARDGRIYIPKSLREKYGDRFRLIDGGNRLILIPVSKEPLEDLKNEWEDVEKSVEELKEGALDEALDEAGR